MMKGTPCSRDNYAPLKTSSKTRIGIEVQGLGPGGVWGSAPTLLAAVKGSRAGYNSPGAPSREAGSCLGADQAFAAGVFYIRMPKAAAVRPSQWPACGRDGPTAGFATS